ncbi:hypothetical protein ACIPL1_18530 [Pseudomonas sp. NPDC090202]|uniref:hypothetical protein n=1 Tax=unclassified Pseudomonas TaxID=196821 RepID=UPI00381A6075
MSSSPSRDLRLYGTAQPVAELQQIQFGDLTFLAQGTQLRRLCLRGKEIMRSVGLVIRDGFWGTHELIQHRIDTREQDQRWWRQIEGVVVAADAEPVLDWTVRMEVASDRLSIHVELEARRDFSTCRAGLMLLHPLAGVVGAPVSVLHSDGRLEEGVFPELISPSQPFFDIRGLSHSPAPGLTLDWQLRGDVFEMEDQRNWSDASFKTYNRPLTWPCPYVIAEGERIEQCIELRIGRHQEYRP